MDRSFSRRARGHFQKQQKRFSEEARSIRVTPKALLIELYQELTTGEFSKDSLDQVARAAAREAGRSVRSDAVQCLLGIWYLLGEPSVKPKASSEDERSVPYGTLRRYAAAIQYGLNLKLSAEAFELQLATHSIAALAKRHDERKKRRPEYAGQPTKARVGRRGGAGD